MSKPKAIIVSGYFNPLHKGHIELFHNAKENGNELFVIVNNDNQRALKGSKEFMSENERALIISELKIVDKVFLSIDQDKTVRHSIEKLFKEFGDFYELFFANGGDQNNEVCPEGSVCIKYGIGLIDGLWDKIQSSSWLLKK